MLVRVSLSHYSSDVFSTQLQPALNLLDLPFLSARRDSLRGDFTKEKMHSLALDSQMDCSRNVDVIQIPEREF